jgi:uncharacterized protein (DUF1778 family)
MMTQVYPHIFKAEQLTGFLESNAVVQAKETIEKQSIFISFSNQFPHRILI